MNNSEEFKAIRIETFLKRSDGYGVNSNITVEQLYVMFVARLKEDVRCGRVYFPLE